MGRWEPHADQRLVQAALVLFDEQGYEDTTVADIAAAAGLTKRTFFRYFPDKREVLFSGSQELERIWVDAVTAAPDGASVMTVVAAGLDAVADMFSERLPFAQVRARVIAANPNLQERELIKLEKLASSVAAALEGRRVPTAVAALAAQTSVGVFHLAFDRWIGQNDPAGLGPLMHESLDALRQLMDS
jgi:AcrR family transcriptional regulator